MVKNYFYLIVGILCILTAVTHTLNETATVLPVLESVGMENSTKSSEYTRSICSRITVITINSQSFHIPRHFEIVCFRR